MIIILKWFEPLETRSAVWFEVVNEYTTLIILILLMCMSDFVTDLEVKHDIGFVFIAVVCLFAAVHIVPMFVKSAKRLQLYLKRFINRRRLLRHIYSKFTACLSRCFPYCNSRRN